MEISLSSGSSGTRPNPERRRKAHSRRRLQEKSTKRSTSKGILVESSNIVWARFAIGSSRRRTLEGRRHV